MLRKLTQSSGQVVGGLQSHAATSKHISFGVQRGLRLGGRPTQHKAARRRNHIDGIAQAAISVPFAIRAREQPRLEIPLQAGATTAGTNVCETRRTLGS